MRTTSTSTSRGAWACLALTVTSACVVESAVPGDGTEESFAEDALVASWDDGELLAPADLGFQNYFGAAVAASGDRAIFGAKGNMGRGAAYIYVRNSSGAWTLEQKLQPSDLSPPGTFSAVDQFGRSVSIAGDVAAVGNPWDDDIAKDAGAVYVFRRYTTGYPAGCPGTGPRWCQEVKVYASDAAEGQGFGLSAGIEGDRLAVGSSMVSAVYVYERSGSTWPQKQKLVPSDGSINAGLGYSVAISGDTIAGGAWGDDQKGVDAGAVYVYRRINNTWTSEAKLVASDGSASARLGSSVGIDGSAIITGAPREDVYNVDSGSAYVFRRSGSTWTQEAKLLPPSGGILDFFGQGVDIEADAVIVGRPGTDLEDYSWEDSGSAFIFRKEGAVWTIEEELIAFDHYHADLFGTAAALANGRAVVGAHEADSAGGSQSGAGYVFESSAATTCLGDLSGDSQVNNTDLSALMNAWGPASPTAPANLNGDGAVNSVDLSILLQHWGPCS